MYIVYMEKKKSKSHMFLSFIDSTFDARQKTFFPHIPNALSQQLFTTNDLICPLVASDVTSRPAEGVDESVAMVTGSSRRNDELHYGYSICRFLITYRRFRHRPRLPEEKYKIPE